MEALLNRMFPDEMEEEDDPERQKKAQEHLEKFKLSEFWASKLADVQENPFPEPIRVNLPGSKESFRTGNGEGCWATVSVSTKMVDDDGKWGGAFVCLLDNTPIYPQWRHLVCGSPVVFQLRGPNKRAVAYPNQSKALKKAQEYEKLYDFSNHRARFTTLNFDPAVMDVSVSLSGVGKDDPHCPYALIDYILPTCEAALSESPHYSQVEKHSVWEKIKQSSAHIIEHTQNNQQESAVGSPDRHHSHDDNPDETRSNKPPHTFASKALQAWKSIQHEDLIQFIKFVAATLSDAPKYDFIPLLELLTLLKTRLEIGDSVNRMRGLRMIVSEPGVTIQSLLFEHAPQHFKPELRLRPDGTMAESLYPRGLAVIWAYEFMDAKIERLIRTTTKGPVFDGSPFRAHPLLTFDADDKQRLALKLRKCLEPKLEDNKDELYRIIHQVIQSRLDTLESIHSFAAARQDFF